MDVVVLAKKLREQATATNERRMLVLTGNRETGYETLSTVLDALDVGISRTTLVGPADRLRCERISETQTKQLLGTTRDIVILDGHEGIQPNTLGRVVGAVDGGGLLVLLVPPLADWIDHRGRFHASLAVPPYKLPDVTTRFTARTVDLLEEHRGIAIVDLDDEVVLDDGTNETVPTIRASDAGGSSEDQTWSTENRPDRPFPPTAYDACLTEDQRSALAAFESLQPTTMRRENANRTDEIVGSNTRRSHETHIRIERPENDRSPSNPHEERERTNAEPRALVLESDRGRGKSSAAGLAATCFAMNGADVIVTAPSPRNTRELFDRAADFRSSIAENDPESVTTHSRATDRRPNINGTFQNAGNRGSIQYLDAADATDAAADTDVVIVEEAAGLSVSRLESLLVADRIAFVTTVHGYEGAGRGFSVRFQDRLDAARHEVETVRLTAPIRYAAGDPVEIWAFRTLLLDARPPVSPLVTDATPQTVDYRHLDTDTLLANEPLLRETFGLLVLAHYRTEPNDLARILDAPNLSVRALLHDGHVVSVALLASEGNLSSETRRQLYRGERIPGNMFPDVLTSHLRDEDAGRLSGHRIVRIATHHDVRSRGLGSHLLAEIRSEFESTVDWLGAGFGATPRLLSFWDDNDFSPIHVSTTRNDASGEFSTLMIHPMSEAGRTLTNRHRKWFRRRFPALCADSLRTLDPDVVRSILRSMGKRTGESPNELDGADGELSDHEWRVVTAAAYGPGLYDVDPSPFERLVMRYFTTNSVESFLSTADERLLVLRVLQHRSWTTVANRLGFHSTRTAMQAFGEACRPLVDRYGTTIAQECRDRFDESN